MHIACWLKETAEGWLTCGDFSWPIFGSCSTLVQRETLRSSIDWEFRAAHRGTSRAKTHVRRVLHCALNIGAKRSGNEPGATIKIQTSLRITTRRCSEGVEAQSREFCTSTLDEGEGWAEIFFAACVNIPAAYSSILGFESWLRSPLLKMYFTMFYSVSPNKGTDSIWDCVTVSSYVIHDIHLFTNRPHIRRHMVLATQNVVHVM